MSTQNYIERIHTSGRPFVVAVTGGGSGAISSLLEVPGASASVMEAIVPYAATALREWLGGTPDQYCSERTARAMAMAAFERARRLSDSDPRTVLGIGATASLASNRPKRGEHRIHVAWQSADTTVVISHTFSSQATRAEEEAIAREIVLSAIAEACGVAHAEPESLQRFVDRREQHASAELTELLLGERQFVGSMRESPIIFPGSFHPFHTAHRRMAELVEQRLGQPVTFEISVTNVDKPSLDFIEIADRVAQFHDSPVLLTRLSTFVEKAAVCPGCTFVVGADTIVRISDPKYYGNDTARRDAAIESLAKQSHCRFVVFGRLVDGHFHTLATVDIPLALREICDEVPAALFREDVSSTALRRG